MRWPSVWRPPAKKRTESSFHLIALETDLIWSHYTENCFQCNHRDNLVHKSGPTKTNGSGCLANVYDINESNSGPVLNCMCVCVCVCGHMIICVDRHESDKTHHLTTIHTLTPLVKSVCIVLSFLVVTIRPYGHRGRHDKTTQHLSSCIVHVSTRFIINVQLNR